MNAIINTPNSVVLLLISCKNKSSKIDRNQRNNKIRKPKKKEGLTIKTETCLNLFMKPIRFYILRQRM